ncbi:unnamed protein product [Brachionus calyciflorus]|uniref:Uncharacterized protein n=1 Tax=Brachionus calyciflorus TaxID=104777 RepID=A0A814F2E0_9BILA|nr:unnamed protein product [Brachionus calyciflorus]
MSAQYDKIDEEQQTDSDSSQSTSLVKNLLNKFSYLSRKTGQTIRSNTVLESDRLDIISIASESSLQDGESLMLREQLWYKNKIILLSVGGVIVVIIFFIALFALEPWK